VDVNPPGTHRNHAGNTAAGPHHAGYTEAFDSERALVLKATLHPQCLISAATLRSFIRLRSESQRDCPSFFSS
jgi:hypothetical protein